MAHCITIRSFWQLRWFGNRCVAFPIQITPSGSVRSRSNIHVVTNRDLIDRSLFPGRLSVQRRIAGHGRRRQRGDGLQHQHVHCRPIFTDSRYCLPFCQRVCESDRICQRNLDRCFGRTGEFPQRHSCRKSPHQHVQFLHLVLEWLGLDFFHEHLADLHLIGQHDGVV